MKNRVKVHKSKWLYKATQIRITRGDKKVRVINIPADSYIWIGTIIGNDKKELKLICKT